MSNLSAFPYIPENSQATPGLWNYPLSIISANIAAIDSGLTSSSPSGNTFSFLTNIETSGGAHFQFLSIGSTPPSYATTAAVTIEVNSATSDYLYLVDAAAQKSSYIIGSRAGGLSDGLNIWDASAGTMIASFSKQSIRFFQNVVGPVFDVGGALASTYNAATFGTGSQSKESRIQAAINQASIDVIARVYVPANMYPYSASSVSFINSIQMVREGGDWGVFDVQAYGASSGGTIPATSAVQGAVNGAGAASGVVYMSHGTYSLDAIYLPTGVSIRGSGIGRTICQMLATANGDGLFLNKSYVTYPGVESNWTTREARITLQDFTLDGNKANVSNRYGIHLRPCSNVIVERIRVVNTGLQGIKLTGCSNARISDCETSQTSLDGIHVVHSVRFIVRGCVIESSGDFGIEASSGEMGAVVPPTLYCGDGMISNNVIVSSTNAAILVRGLVDGALNPNNYPVRNVGVNNNQATGCGQGIFVQDTVYDIDVTGNTCSRNSGVGIQVFPTGYPVANNIQIEGNICSRNSGNGINVSALYESSIIGNHVTQNWGHGLSGSIYQCDVLGNTIRNNNMAVAAATYNLNVTATSQDAEIRDNDFADRGTPNVTADVKVATGQTRVRFVGNNVGTATGPCGDLPITLVDGATVAIDASVGNPLLTILTATGGVGATRAIGTPTDVRAGQRLVTTFIQDGTGGRAITWAAVFKNVWSDAGNGANLRSSIAHIYDGTNWNQDGVQTPYA